MSEIDNSALRAAVLEKIMPYVMDLWQRKNTEYANVPFMFEELGEVVEIIRKAMKLRAQIYLKEGSSDFEGPEQVAMDLIGHALMLIYMLDPDKWDSVEDLQQLRHYHSMGGKYPHGQHSNSITITEKTQLSDAGPVIQCPMIGPHIRHHWYHASGVQVWCVGVSNG